MNSDESRSGLGPDASGPGSAPAEGYEPSAWINATEAELATLKAERDAINKDKCDDPSGSLDLHGQMSAQAQNMVQLPTPGDEEVARPGAFQSELEALQSQLQAARSEVESERLGRLSLYELLQQLQEERSRLQQNYKLAQMELEILRAECERRFPALLLSEERGRELARLQAELERMTANIAEQAGEREAQTMRVEALEMECAELRGQLSTAIESHRQAEAEAAARPLPPAPHAPDPQERQRIQQLEQELKAARDETKFTLEQLFQVQEELERYFLLAEELKRSIEGGNSALGQGSAPDATPQGDAATINSNRARLLASA